MSLRGSELVMTMDWRHRAACRDVDPELFFPVGNTGPAIAQIEEAKKVCMRCEVREPCLQWALESGQDSGVWGGLSEDERRAMKRRAARNRARLMENALPELCFSLLPSNWKGNPYFGPFFGFNEFDRTCKLIQSQSLNNLKSKVGVFLEREIIWYSCSIINHRSFH